MSTSLLYHGLGLKNIEYLGTEYKDGSIIFHIKTKEKSLRCANCNSKNVIKKGLVQRKFKTVPLGFKQVFLLADIQRLECRDCGKIRQEKIAYANEKKAIPIEWNDI